MRSAARQPGTTFAKVDQRRSLVVAKKDLPSTVQRSPQKAQRTWSKTHDAAAEEYGDGERAHRTAYSSLKHSFEKVGDHWEPKEGGKKGPSDAQAAKSGASARRGGNTAGGVDANASVSHLRERAKQLGITGRSKMNKQELVDALQKASRKDTAKARKK
jgi:cation transport regulator ChaB